jgi:hypothetical protein
VTNRACNVFGWDSIPGNPCAGSACHSQRPDIGFENPTYNPLLGIPFPAAQRPFVGRDSIPDNLAGKSTFFPSEVWMSGLETRPNPTYDRKRCVHE